MSGIEQKPSRWYYILAILLPMFVCVGTVLLVYQNVPKLPGALENMGIKNLTQVVVPGSAEINFPKEGAYAVYYEYRSVIDGVGYARGQNPPGIDCQLISNATGEEVALAPDFVEGNVYTTQNRERAGVLINSISIHQPGNYTFSCQYPDGRNSPQFVLAVGPNIVWEFFNIAVKPLAACLIGAPLFVFACGVSILIVGVVAFRRNRSKSAN